MRLHPVEILGEGATVLNLVGAVLMYESNRGDVYATSHPVVADAEQRGRKVNGAGVPLSKGALAKFADVTGDDRFLDRVLWLPAGAPAVQLAEPDRLVGAGAGAHDLVQACRYRKAGR